LQVSRRIRLPLVSVPKIGSIPMIVTGTHDPYLVALSILVACFAYTALDLGGHVAAARGDLRVASGW
jgi:NO-binding membrane sensor protein with MHYT domain